MSTYNGEKYLREQLDSFLKLEGVKDIKVLIRDDGSADHTVEILREYNQRYGFEVVMGENLGVNDSLFWSFAHCDLSCDYFAISDQDDVWLREKLKTAINHLRNFDDSKPAMFASCSQIVDEELRFRGSSIVPKKGISFFNAMVQNVTPGHTQVFNLAMMKELLAKGISDVHVIDWWLYLVATGIGNIAFDRNFTVMHRQHGDNAVGYDLNFWEQSMKRLKNVRTGKGNSISLQLRAFYNRYGQVLDEEKKREVERYFSSQRNLLRRICYVVTCRVFRQTWFETMIFKVLYVLGKYNV
ncbi:glycosyltransferase [Desulfosporosinus sp. SB140]|uniref:glycosyltransferase n=1 Tax=Desulfosporosinus paludis TaxID=3115649 RepID=UPI00388CFA4E